MYETVDLNIIPVGNMPVVHCSQYDTNRLIRFVLTDGKDPFTFGVLVSVTTTIRKVDGTLWKYEDTAPVIVSSRYEIATDEQMTACAGNNYGELTIKYRDPDVSEDEIKISTLNFILKVELSPETGGLVSLSEINNLASQIALIVNQQLDNYYTKDEIDDQIEEIVSEQVTPIVSSIVSEQVPPIVQSELGNYYTKTETDTYFYNKSETDTLLDGKANTSDLPDMDDYYTKTDTDTLLSGKVSNSTLSNYYTKSEVDALVGTFDIIDTASGAIATFDNGGDNIPVKSLVTEIVAVQSGTGIPSPSNVRPITGFDTVVITNKDDIDSPTTTDTHTTTLLETIYGGSLDVSKGEGVKTIVDKLDLGSLSWTRRTDTSVPIFQASLTDWGKAHETADIPYILCEMFNPVSATNVSQSGYDNSVAISADGKRIYIQCQTYTDATTFTNAVNGKYILYELATPTTFNTTPEQIPTLSGTNNIYSNSGDVEVTYFNDKADQLVALYNVLGGI